MVFVGDPLLYKHSHKQRRQHKFHAGEVDRQLACQITQDTSDDPVYLVKERYQKTVLQAADALWSEESKKFNSNK